MDSTQLDFLRKWKPEQEICFRKAVERIPSTTYATFGLYRYPAKFIPQVIAYILENYEHSGRSLIDPFAGCGTAGLVARLYGYDYELWDLNPMLEILHQISLAEPVDMDSDEIIRQITICHEKFIPQWSNISYWYQPEVLPFLYQVWGFYHSLQQPPVKRILLVPFLKVSRLFSYDDPQRQKLSRSPRSFQRVHDLLQGDWKAKFFTIVNSEIGTLLRKLREYQSLNPDNTVRPVIRGGVDAISESAQNNAKWGFLITSPPYLQAQEYIRRSKMDLFWLGYLENQVKELQSKELPYRDVEPIPIHSEAYQQCRKTISELHMLKMFDRYFYSVLGALTRLSENVLSRLFLFVGSATVRGNPVPIDRIFAEHFVSLGWNHEMTLVDSIVSRVMFRSQTNPATGLNDSRIPTERLVILERR